VVSYHYVARNVINKIHSVDLIVTLIIRPPTKPSWAKYLGSDRIPDVLSSGCHDRGLIITVLDGVGRSVTEGVD
jgi:hypothetical protein